MHQALTALPEDYQRRLGVIADWKNGPHQLTYRQAEYTFGLVAGALARDEPDGLPSPVLQAICDDLLEASVPEKPKHASASLAVDWTDLETFSRPPPHGTSDCADPEASWGHRKNNLLRSQDELFYGYYLSAGTMAREENGPAVPELARRVTVSSCLDYRVRAMVPVLTAMPADPLGSISATSSTTAATPTATQTPTLPLRAAGAQLVQDLHPHDRGPKGTHDGAIISNGNLYCPRTPRPLLELGPLARTATGEQAADARPKTAETRPPQARPHHPRRRRRLPPRRVPRRHGQGPLPAAASVNDPGPGPARDPAPAGTFPGLLRTADDHRATRGTAKTAQKHIYRPPPGAAPTPAAPAPSAASPPSRTPPPTPSAGAGAASWA